MPVCISTIVPGHLGQAWIGASPNQVLTLTSAAIRLDNSLDLRANEFGATTPSDISAGERNVGLDFIIFAQDDAGTEAMYKRPGASSPVSVLFQLGEQAGEMCGVYMPAVVLETPDSTTRRRDCNGGSGMLVRKAWWMMNCLSLSRRSTRYPSCTWVKSKVH